MVRLSKLWRICHRDRRKSWIPSLCIIRRWWISTSSRRTDLPSCNTCSIRIPFRPRRSLTCCCCTVNTRCVGFPSPSTAAILQPLYFIPVLRSGCRCFGRERSSNVQVLDTGMQFIENNNTNLKCLFLVFVRFPGCCNNATNIARRRLYEVRCNRNAADRWAEEVDQESPRGPSESRWRRSETNCRLLRWSARKVP